MGLTFLAPKTPEFFPEPIALGEGSQVLGRARNCNIVVGDNTISRKHAEILTDGDTVQIRDLASLNGTFINEVRVASRQVQLGDHVRFGRVAFLAVPAEDQQKMVDDESTDQCEDPGKSCELHATSEILSPREARIFDLLVHGLAEKQIAGQLKISRHTVHTHIKAIYRQLGVHSRPELLAKFFRRK